MQLLELASVCLTVLLAAPALGCSSADDGPTDDGDATGTGASSGSGSGAASGSGSSGAGGEASSFTSCPGSSPGHQTFNAFWTAFDQTYALFDIRMPDESWAAVGEEACAQLDESASGQELFDLLIGMARHLDDGHVNLEAPELGLDEDAWVSEYPHYQQLYELETNAEAKYLDGPMSWTADEWIGSGTIGDIGYVSITAMEDYSESGEEADDVAAAHQAMSEVMSSLAASKAIVVDVRANEGGWDGVSLAIASWFAGPATLAWSEQLRDGPAHDDFGEWWDVQLEAAPAGAFAGEVVVLTSGGSFSAAETFLLAIRVRDQVTLLGEPSSGHFSDQLDGTLPNGWIYSLSHERYRAADGEIYEALGVPVEVPFAFDVQAFASGKDVMLEAALELLSAN